MPARGAPWTVSLAGTFSNDSLRLEPIRVPSVLECSKESRLHRPANCLLSLVEKENALPRLVALPALVEELEAPDVLCLQELRIRQKDTDAVSAGMPLSAMVGIWGAREQGSGAD
jgi:hypothetical protein